MTATSTIVTTRINALAGSLSDDPDVIGAALADEAWAEATVGSLVTEPYTQGTLARCEKNGVKRVELSASGGCDFCDGYDGRILTVGVDESGMPPLHNGCNCTVEPLEE